MNKIIKRVFKFVKDDNIIFLWDIIKAHKIKLAKIGGLMLLVTGLTTITAYVYMLIIDHISKKVSSLFLLVGLYFGINIIIYALKVYLSFNNKNLSNNIEIKLKNDIFKELLNKDGNLLTESNTGEFMTLLVNDSFKIVSILSETLYLIIFSIIQAIGMVCFLFFIRWELLLLILTIQPIMSFIQKRMRNLSFKLSDEFRNDYSKSIGITKEYTSNILDIISLGISRYAFNNYNNILKKQKQSELKMTVASNINSCILGLISFVPLCLILIIGGIEVNKGILTIGGLLLFIQYSSQLFTPFNNIYESAYTYSTALPSIKRVIKFLKASNQETGNEMEHVYGKISIKNIDFAYNYNNEILKDASAEFNPGNRYSITGESGCGKSTLCKLLLRLWKVDKGNIYIDDIDIYDYNKDSIRKNVTYIAQDCFLFNDTIYNNIILDNNEVSYEEFCYALKYSGMWETVQELPLKENTIVGDKGVKLSGGQKQRIVLARAMIRNTPIIILDEPTAALDYENEARVINHLFEVFKNSTLIIITHKQEVIHKCDVKYKVLHKKIELVIDNCPY